MRINPKARLDRSRISDAGRGSGGGGLGGGGTRIPIPTGRAGGGMAGLIVIVLIVILTSCLGGGLPGIGGGDSGTEGGTGDTDRYEQCLSGADAQESLDCTRVLVENSLVDYWRQALPAQSDATFTPATVRTFTGSTSTGCGQASSSVGPFYCPPDQRIYLDTSFFDDVLERQLGGPDGGFVEPYVLAHEYGHHIQNLLGTMSRVKTQQGPRSDAVRLELQADCYAGMWTKSASTTQDADGVVLIEGLTQADIDQALAAASAVGDDKIQEKTQGQVTSETWTHGSAASRQKWFETGYRQGTLEACDTWAVTTP